MNPLPCWKESRSSAWPADSPEHKAWPVLAQPAWLRGSHLAFQSIAGRFLGTRALPTSHLCPRRSVLADVDMFDPDFFGIYPREAELMDPQASPLSRSCWQRSKTQATIPHLSGFHRGERGLQHADLLSLALCITGGFIQKFTGGYQIGNYLEMLGNSPDFLSTAWFPKLNLRGPSFTLQAGCSTSLVAVCQHSRRCSPYQSDMALAGGCSSLAPKNAALSIRRRNDVARRALPHLRRCCARDVFGSGVAVVP